MKNLDLAHMNMKQTDVTNFRVRFQVDVPSATAGVLQPVFAETRQVHAVCPGTMTKLRKFRECQLEMQAEGALAKHERQRQTKRLYLENDL